MMLYAPFPLCYVYTMFPAAMTVTAARDIARRGVLVILSLFSSSVKSRYVFSRSVKVNLHTGQCKSTGGCYNELVVAYFSTGGGVKWWKR